MRAQVSDQPTISSGAFKFKFDVAKYGLLGYITPEWCALPPRVAAEPAGTTIWLPFRAGGPAVSAASVGITPIVTLENSG